MKDGLLSGDLYNLLFSGINTCFYEAFNMKDNKCVILFLRMCALTQVEVLARLWICERGDPLGSRAQILFNKEVTENIDFNCTLLVAVYVDVSIIITHILKLSRSILGASCFLPF